MELIELIKNNSTMLLFIALILVLLIAKAYFDSKSKKQNKILHNCEDGCSGDIATEYSQFINEYNLFIDKINILSEDAQTHIAFLKDIDSLNALEILLNKTHKKMSETRQSILNLEECLNKGHLELYEEHANVVSQQLFDLDQLCGSINRLKENASPSIHAYEDYANESIDDSINTSASQRVYFKGCESLEDLNKRYRLLAKVYHPDMGSGDQDSFVNIQKEYEELKKKY